MNPLYWKFWYYSLYQEEYLVFFTQLTWSMGIFCGPTMGARVVYTQTPGIYCLTITTYSNVCLVSHHNEVRSEIWYAVQIAGQFSILTIVYPNLGFNSFSLTFLVPMYSSCRNPLRHTVMWKFRSLSFITKCILLERCLVFLVFSIFLAINTAYLISNIKRGACSWTTFGY